MRRPSRRGRNNFRKNINTRFSEGKFSPVQARELLVSANSWGNLYTQRGEPIILNLQKKFKNGTYDRDKAVTLWKYWADDAAKMYEKDFPGTKFSAAERQAVAIRKEREVYAEMRIGNFTMV